VQNVTYLVLRRMRTPLLVLLAAYAISILGMTLVPGLDPDGNPWRMDFFHAFYFISYMATTIGFGEVPYAFTSAQRLWVTFSIYLTVIAWLYAIGSILGLMQDPAFRRAVIEGRFARSVRRIKEPFYLIAGYGDTGKALVRALTERYMRAVVLDANPDQINVLRLKDYLVYVPGLCATVSLPVHLKEAGLTHPQCRGVVALTDKDYVNLKVAITSKLLNPPLTVICRAQTQDFEANMASFGTDHIIDPFVTFAEELAMALHKPGRFLLYEWLTGVPHSRLPIPRYPRHGKWVLCGFGRFGKAVYNRLIREDLEIVIVEATPEKTGLPPVECITGRGTEADTLVEAGIMDAVGIVAGTDIDTNNLSILMTARALKPDLFMAIRQNRNANRELFEAVAADLIMHPSAIIAREVRVMLTLPMLGEFLRLTGDRNNQWATALASRMIGVVGEVVPHLWSVVIDPEVAGAVCRSLAEEDLALRLHHLTRDPRDRARPLACVCLMLARGGERVLAPEDDTELRPGDRLLFCGAYGIEREMEWILQNANALRYVVTGEEGPDGWVWRWLRRRWWQQAGGEAPP
jgi:voltage-gated potassium channel